MREAAVHFVGEHDFASFRTVGCAAKTTIRRIDLCEVSRKGEFLHIDVKGGGFLRNMVRLMAGTLIEVGQGKIQPKKIVDLLESKGKAGATAPPQGLCLVEVLY
jgi:tRNA pseudouridine38-40 synthase